MDIKSFYKNEYRIQTKIVPLNVRMFEIIEAMKPESVFEFGCNCGKNLKALKQRGIKNLSGIDINIKALRYGRRNFKANVKYGDENSLKLIPDNTYDLVFTSSVLCHLPEVKETIKQLRRIGRRLLIVETHETPNKYFINHEYKGFKKIDEMHSGTAHYIIYEDDILRDSLG